jgi:hypothetical protein
MLLMIFGVLGAFFAVRSLGRANQQVSQENSAQAAMVQAQDALLGFAAVNGRLPCPASAASNGIESPLGGSTAVVPCTNPYNGFLPAATLGISGAGANGYMLDEWSGRIRYAVTTAAANATTTANGIQVATTAVFGPAANLRICASATGITATTCGAATAITTNAVAVIFSTGSNAGAAGGIDEAANQNADQVFVSHAKTDSTAANGEFDDLLVWLVPGTCPGACPPSRWQPANSLFNVMTLANKLP